jgi:hypothetical protein
VNFRHGISTFLTCTLVNARYFNGEAPDNRGFLRVEKCLLGNMNEALVRWPQDAPRLSFADNVYFNAPGIRFGGTMCPASQVDAYLAANKYDRGSRWMDVDTDSATHLPKAVTIDSASGHRTRVGASLPKSVWKLYGKYRNVATSPDGVHF